VLEGLLTLAPHLSSTLTDIEILLKIRITSSAAFERARDGSPSLVGLMPARHQVISFLQRLRDANVDIQPFTLGIAFDSERAPSINPVFIFEYIPQEYNTPRRRETLPKRMSVEEPPEVLELLGSPESREVFGGDELRYWVDLNHLASVIMSLSSSEDIDGVSNTAR
jgi:hypothetical protein